MKNTGRINKNFLFESYLKRFKDKGIRTNLKIK